ncbi:DNA-protecting protein DprA [Candidatus Saccharibacteria bacterium]|nr:DNA-protecting protein DprA [Candidatus Saccharibacteria bacterium]
MKSNTTSSEKHKFLQRGKDIDPKVEIFYYIGALPRGRPPTVAIVGSRKPTPYGIEVTRRLAFDLSARGVVIVSGLALGVDGIAHQAALEAGGTTVAILAGGLDTIYPTRHTRLAADIVAAGGALLSEHPDGTPPMQFRFLERNRIVSGLSDGVVVVEAAARSGTLSTASWALQQGRVVMAVPGNVTSPMSAGCNQLLKSGASVVTQASDVLEAIGLQSAISHTQSSIFEAASAEEQALLAELAAGERDGELLQQKSGLSMVVYMQTMTMLEITGKIRALGANQWTLG